MNKLDEGWFRLSKVRNHKSLGMYLAIKAWLKGVDCIAIDRDEIKSHFGIKSLSTQRVAELAADVKDLFPFCVILHPTRNTVGTVCLSRSKLPFLYEGMIIDPIVGMKRITSEGIKLVRIKLPTPETVVSDLALMTNGFDVPTSQK